MLGVDPAERFPRRGWKPVAVTVAVQATADPLVPRAVTVTTGSTARNSRGLPGTAARWSAGGTATDSVRGADGGGVVALADPVAADGLDGPGADGPGVDGVECRGLADGVESAALSDALGLGVTLGFGVTLGLGVTPLGLGVTLGLGLAVRVAPLPGWLGVEASALAVETRTARPATATLPTMNAGTRAVSTPFYRQHHRDD